MGERNRRRRRALSERELASIRGGGAPGSVDVYTGQGAVLDGGGFNDGVPPPEVRVDGNLVN